MKSEEYNIQKEFVKYIRYQHPNLMFCSSSGGMRTSLSQAVKNKLTGYSKGYPDMFFPVPKNGYYGLFIEVKKTKGGVKSKEQKEWIEYLNSQGYKAEFAEGLEQCIKILNQYLN